MRRPNKTVIKFYELKKKQNHLLEQKSSSFKFSFYFELVISNLLLGLLHSFYEDFSDEDDDVFDIDNVNKELEIIDNKLLEIKENLIEGKYFIKIPIYLYSILQ